ncbi:MAG: HAMP domain-containing sensor histidine kinase, partial [Phycisphaeraceae bacterium]|nr:HAMP domain-containing sensor histidine kinase [Phycisphaeraceae bacterium]
DRAGLVRHRDDRRRAAQWQQALSRRVLAVTAGAAHEMNNPLMVISGRAQTLGLKLPADHPARRDAEGIQAAADELSRMIEQLHELAEPYRPKLGPATVDRIVAEALHLAGRRGVRSVRIIGRVPVRSFRTDKNAIAAAIAELLVNAHEVDPKTSPKLAASVTHADGRSMEVRVMDSGPGLSAEVLDHAFDPFFSARKAGRGAGMGLARARRWIEALGGRLSLVNRRGGGAVATVAVPMEQEGGVGREKGNRTGPD